MTRSAICYPPSSRSHSELVQDYHASALTFLEMFGMRTVAEQLTKCSDCLENVITLDGGLHEMFGLFEFWLDKVPNQVELLQTF